MILESFFLAKSIMTSIVDFVYIYLPLTLNAVRNFLLGIAFSWILFKILYKGSPNNYDQSNVISKKSKTIHLEELLTYIFHSGIYYILATNIRFIYNSFV